MWGGKGLELAPMLKKPLEDEGENPDPWVEEGEYPEPCVDDGEKPEPWLLRLTRSAFMSCGDDILEATDMEPSKPTPDDSMMSMESMSWGSMLPEFYFNMEQRSSQYHLGFFQNLSQYFLKMRCLHKRP